VSTKSRKRNKLREAMNRAVEEARTTSYRRGEFDGASRMRADMNLLLPPTESILNGRGGFDSFVVIKQFPNPYESPPRVRIAVPGPGVGIHGRAVRHLEFAPTEYRCDYDWGSDATSVRWFQWEVQDRSSEPVAAMFGSMGKLHHVSRLLEEHALRAAHTSASMARAFNEASVLVEECSDEIRRRLGRFAPVRVVDPRDAAHRTRFPSAFDGRPW
jgi:hypothetical protein